MHRRAITAAGLLLASPLASCEPFPGTGSGTSSSSGGASEAGASTSGDSGTANGRQPFGVQAFCARLINECGQPLVLSECVRSFTPVRVIAACASGIGKATCAELTQASSALLRSCFPACNGTIATCNSDGTLTECTVAGTSQVVDCQAWCVAQGFSAWTGTCGASFQGQVAERPQCWCK